MSKRIGIIIINTFVGFHIFDVLNYDFITFSASIVLDKKRFTCGFIFLIYGIEFEVDWGVFDEQEDDDGEY